MDKFKFFLTRFLTIPKNHIEYEEEEEEEEGGGAKPPAGGDDKGFDPSKLDDSQFSKVFEDPRLFKHARFAELRDRAKKAKEYEEAEQKREEERMIEEKKYKELADIKAKEAESAREEVRKMRVDTLIQSKAVKAGIVDPEIVSQIIDRSKIQVGEDGAVTGVDEAIAELVTAKPYLRGAGAPPIGSPTNPPNGGGGVKKFKHSQILDPAFYAKNSAEIDEAIRKGQVEDDLSH